MRQSWIAMAAMASAAALAGTASAEPVVYTLRTVADGKLGVHVFAEALVTIQMRSDTGTVQKKASSNGGFLYANTGTATISITDGAWRRVATFETNEIYVFYDTGIGVAGFGSKISPTYPISLDCSDYAYPSDSAYTKDCTQGDWWGNYDWHSGTLGVLADPLAASLAASYDAASSNVYFPFTLSNDPAYNPLPQSLSHSTLLTGRAHSCATTYTISSNVTDGDLVVCSGPAAAGLKTDHGRLFLQDQVGGSGTGGAGGWAWANTGALQVEVMTGD